MFRISILEQVVLKATKRTRLFIDFSVDFAASTLVTWETVSGSPHVNVHFLRSPSFAVAVLRDVTCVSVEKREKGPP